MATSGNGQKSRRKSPRFRPDADRAASNTSTEGWMAAQRGVRSKGHVERTGTTEKQPLWKGDCSGGGGNLSVRASAAAVGARWLP